MDNFNVETASYRELQKKGAELNIGKVAGVPADELRALVAEALAKESTALTPPEVTQPNVQNSPVTAPKPKTREIVQEASKEPVQLMCRGRVVVNVENKIISGIVYKDVYFANGEVHTMSKEEYQANVTQE